jgi:import inner membrane translocase subunit TIM50
MTKPPIDKLLPDIPPLPPGYEIPKTLVLNLSGTIVKTDYVFGKGAEIMKRPGLSNFLKKLS